MHNQEEENYKSITPIINRKTSMTDIKSPIVNKIRVGVKGPASENINEEGEIRVNAQRSTLTKKANFQTSPKTARRSVSPSGARLIQKYREHAANTSRNSGGSLNRSLSNSRLS